MNIHQQEIEIKNLDHLGIVAGIIDELGIVKKINELIGNDSREKVSVGQVVKAILLNGIGFVSRPLYLFPQFFQDKPSEHLLGEGIKAEELNDDKLGRTMDKLYRFGLSQVFLTIALGAVKKYGVATKYSHLDSTSFHLHGEYNDSDREKEAEIVKENPIIITQGYSRDHRPDLKQCVRGNESDKAVFGKILKEFAKELDFQSIMVCDSALYSKDNLKLIEKLKWITRVPLSLKLAKNLVQNTSLELETSRENGYSYREEKVTYAGIEQRWLVVESIERKESDLKKLKEKIEEEATSASREIAKILKQEFTTAAEAGLKIKELDRKLKYHQLTDAEVNKISRVQQPVIYKVQANLATNQEAITGMQQQAGRFILATNLLDKQELKTDEILTVYKQQQSCERGFRFLKDPLFFADSLFLKNPARIETMMMLMVLCLLVYSIGQRQLRASLQASKATVKNQLNKLTDSPTLRWVFQCFQGVHVLILQGVKKIVNLTTERQRLLQFLPENCQKYYLSG